MSARFYGDRATGDLYHVEGGTLTYLATADALYSLGGSWDLYPDNPDGIDWYDTRADFPTPGGAGDLLTSSGPLGLPLVVWIVVAIVVAVLIKRRLG